LFISRRFREKALKLSEKVRQWNLRKVWARKGLALRTSYPNKKFFENMAGRGFLCRFFFLIHESLSTQGNEIKHA